MTKRINTEWMDFFKWTFSSEGRFRLLLKQQTFRSIERNFEGLFEQWSMFDLFNNITGNVINVYAYLRTEFIIFFFLRYNSGLIQMGVGIRFCSRKCKNLHFLFLIILVV